MVRRQCQRRNTSPDSNGQTLHSHASSARPAFVNRLHDFFGPTYCISDGAQRRRNAFPAVKLCQLAGSEDTRRDQQHALAALVHIDRLSYSLFVPHWTHANAQFLPYRPLPFLGGINAQNRPEQGDRLITKLLKRGNFPITLEKLSRQKINSPSRHQSPRIVPS